MASKKTLSLLGNKPFAAYFWAQFTSVFNDHLFKNALLLSFAFHHTLSTNQSNTIFNIACALFILPFMLFSSIAGQMAEKYDKQWLLRRIKLAEIGIILLACFGFYFHNMALLLGILFLTGTQSAFLGPVKFSILPHYLKPNELLGANGLVEMGVYLGILSATLLSGLLIAVTPFACFWICLCLLFASCSGYKATQFMPKTKAVLPELNLDFRLWKTSLQLCREAKTNSSAFKAILGISWFWTFSSLMLTHLPKYVDSVLLASSEVATLFLVLFSIGIALGSFLCEKLSKQRIELSFIPLSLFVISLLTLDFAYLSGHMDFIASSNLIEFLQSNEPFRLLIDLFLIGFFSSLFVVPLYTTLQTKTKETFRSQMIAANNIMNTCLIISGAALATICLYLGGSIVYLFLGIALCHLGFSLLSFKHYGKEVCRFLSQLILNIFYRIDAKGIEHIPSKGPAVISCNHVSYLDPLIILAASPRPIRFVMDYHLYKLPVVNFFCRAAKVIPITTMRENKALVFEALHEIDKALNQGELIGIFPEGAITRHGQMNPFRPGIKQIIEKNPVPIIPMAIKGLWGSFFSFKHGKALRHLPKELNLRKKIELVAAQVIDPFDLSLMKLENQIKQLMVN